jgi:hypothetical protein
MKAIETVYNGYRFRSRLEARWAVFFDHAGIEYEYEPEGFELDDGTRYLPDFYFPEYDWYAEVKAPRDGAKEDVERASRFIGNPIKVLILLGNIPDASESPVYHYNALYFNQLRNEVVVERVCFEPTGAADQEPFNRFGIASWQHIDHLSYTSLFCALEHINRTLEPITDKDLTILCRKKNSYWEDLDDESISNLSSCYQAARQARFEHGEKP